MTELGVALRSWRDRLSPATVGLPQGRARRTRGLRREELADLAGVSVDYVVRLEQGRFATPSAQVVSALARALQLTGDERDHLYRLAGLVPPYPAEVSDRVPSGVARVVDRLGDAAVAVFAADWQLIRWNRTWAALFGDPSATPPQLRNFARDTFPGINDEPQLTRRRVISLPGRSVEAAVVSDLRRATGRFPRSRRLAALIETLSRDNAQFATLWAEGAVGAHREEHKIIDHPDGPITVDCDVVTDGDVELKIVILTAEPGSPDEALLRGLTETVRL